MPVINPDGFDVSEPFPDRLQKLTVSDSPLFLQARVAQRNGEVKTAESLYQQLLEEFPDAAVLHYALAQLLARQNRFEAAVPHYQRLLEQFPQHVNARINLGTILFYQGKVEPALEHFRHALAVDPDSILARKNLAAVLYARGQLGKAISQYRTVLEKLNTPDPDILNQLGAALYEAGAVQDAQKQFERAIHIDPQSAQAYNNLGAIYNVQEDFVRALEMHQRAAQLDPTFRLAQVNIGKILEQQSRHEQAQRAYRRALTLEPDPLLELHLEMLCPPIMKSNAAIDEYRTRMFQLFEDWETRSINLDFAHLHTSRAEPPIEWAYHGRDNLALKQKYAALFANKFASSLFTHRTPKLPFHIAFLVTPGHEGVFMRCMRGILNQLDPRRFRVTLVCSRLGLQALRSGITASHIGYLFCPLRFDHIIEHLRAAHFDLLYFWEVGTDSTNYFLPFCRLAPIQCTGWGWPDTTAAPEMDFYLSSQALTTPDSQSQFSERLVSLVQMPPFWYRTPIPQIPLPRAHFGLPQNKTIYFCAQSLRKIHPDFDPMLREVLRRDAQGLAVFVHDTHARLAELLMARWRNNLPDVLAQIRFLPRLMPRDYFHVLANADVILDTPHFGGANTAYDAFSAAVPVVTLSSQFPRGRYTEALYRLMGIHECIAMSIKEYAEIALALGIDRGFRARIHSQIRARSLCLFQDKRAVTQFQDWVEETLTVCK